MDIESVAAKYGRSASTIWRYFDNFKDKSELKSFTDKHINLVVDTTYFGRSFGYMIFRAHGTNLYYQQVQNETVAWLACGLDILDRRGYSYKSITIDGRTGFINYLKEHYPDVPLQYCQFHQKMTIKRYLTNNPKTVCGLELQSFMKGFMSHDYDSFNEAYAALKQRWTEFLKERNENKSFKHKTLRAAFNSLKRNVPYLFTYKAFESLNIPNTTNSCDGHFAHFKDRVKRHCGLKRFRRVKLIEFIIKNS
jgi:hypothetical protein